MQNKLCSIENPKSEFQEPSTIGSTQVFSSVGAKTRTVSAAQTARQGFATAKVRKGSARIPSIFLEMETNCNKKVAKRVETQYKT